MIYDKGQHLLGRGFKDILVQKIWNGRCEQLGRQNQNEAILKKLYSDDPTYKPPPGLGHWGLAAVAPLRFLSVGQSMPPDSSIP